MFFTIWYGVYDSTERQLTYSSGGHPPALLVTGDTRSAPEVARLSTSGFLVGAMPDAQYQNATARIGGFGALFVYSDGIYEVKRASDGEMLELDEWLEMLARQGADAEAPLEALLARVRQIQGHERFDDDVSLLRVGFTG